MTLNIFQINKITIFIILVLGIGAFGCEPEGKEHIEYFENGKIYIWADTSNPESTVIKRFYPAGGIEKISHFRYGEFHGMSIEYYENGKEKKVQNFENGKLIGRSINFFENGDTIAVTYYNDQGDLVFERQYNEKGEVVGTVTESIAKIFNEDKKLLLIVCRTGDTSEYNRIKFDVGGNIIDFGGKMNCLTKGDSLLLNKTNSDWESIIVNKK